MKRQFLIFFLLLGLASTAMAQGFDYKDIDIKVALKNAELVKGEKGDILFTLKIPFGYVLTTNDAQPSVKVLNEVPGFSFGELNKPEPHTVDAVGGHYMSEVTLSMPVQALPDTEPGEYDVVFGFVLQVCEEGGMCFYPSEAIDIQRKLKIKLVKN